MPRFAMGVDIGATNTKRVVIDEDGAVALREVTPTPQDSDPRILVDRIVEGAGQFRTSALEQGFELEGVGFTIPHFYEGRDWIQQQTNNMPSLEGYAMRPQLAAAFGTPLAMINDLSAAGLAEYLSLIHI